MANTYTQINIQFVFAVKYRNGLIHSSFKEELYQYISGIIKAHNHKLLAINGMPDHLQILVGMRPSQSVSDLMQYIKANSSKWINEKKFLKVKLNGRKVMVLSRILNHMFKILFTTFRIKKKSIK